MTAPALKAVHRGRAHIASGDWPAAARAFSDAAVLCPESAPIRAVLGVALLNLRAFPEAERHLRAALALDPDEPSAGLHLGEVLIATGRAKAAAAQLGALVARHPNDPQLHAAHGRALYAAGPRMDAAIALQKAADLGTAADALTAALAWLELDAPAPAIRALRLALEREPRRPGAHARLGLLLLDRGEQGTAEHHLRAALALQPGNAAALGGLARLHLRRREVDAAEALLAPLVAGQPDTESVALWADIQRRRGQPAAALPALRAAVQRTREPGERNLLLHRLAELHDATGDHDRAFGAWQAAKGLQVRTFNPHKYTQAIRATKACYAPGQDLLRAPQRDPLPVFIVGMPRSGTSLLEQMLDSHPQLQGVGEREDVRVLAANLSKRLDPTGLPYFLHLDRISPDWLEQAAARHLAQLRGLVGPGVVRAIDKMPHNFLHIGLISQLFPGARILYCARDPIDTCFSCYRQRFGAGLPYTVRLDWLGHFYNGCAGLMAHWRALAPLPIHTVQYENLVQQPEATLRGVLDFLGVGWDARCLAFHQNTRDVGTASHEQVQRPLYTSSIGRSARYARHLAPLRAVLEQGPVA